MNSSTLTSAQSLDSSLSQQQNLFILQDPTEDPNASEKGRRRYPRPAERCTKPVSKGLKRTKFCIKNGWCLYAPTAEYQLQLGKKRLLKTALPNKSSSRKTRSLLGPSFSRTQAKERSPLSPRKRRSLISPMHTVIRRGPRPIPRCQR